MLQFQPTRPNDAAVVGEFLLYLFFRSDMFDASLFQSGNILCESSWLAMVLTYLIRLPISQSKECQTLSWKASHKINCVPNPTVAALNGTKPEKFSTEWVQLEVDKMLSKWMAEWRRCFMEWTMLALDLANHPPNRVVTHWYVQ